MLSFKQQTYIKLRPRQKVFVACINLVSEGPGKDKNKKKLLKATE